MRREEIIKQFIWGLSILKSYIEYNGKLNLQDINVFAESFMCDLLNILFNFELKNANGIKLNNPGFDLISEKDKCIIQVSATKEPQKIINTLSVLEENIEKRKGWVERFSKIRNEKNRDINSYTSLVQYEETELAKKINSSKDLSGYRIFFMILTTDATKQRDYNGNEKNGYSVPAGIVFNQNDDIWDFNFLINKLNNISEIDGESIVFEKLDVFMRKNNNIFVRRVDKLCEEDRIDKIINEYADNFNEKLFRHRYIENSNVKLCNLYVDPIFKTKYENRTQNIVKILDEFLWNNSSCRILFVEGDAAIGKTSWVSWLCYHYLALDEIGKTVFLDRKIVCIRLRELDFSGDNLTAEKCILDYLGISSLEEFNRKYEDCVMLLDGADEISMVRNLLDTTIEEFIAAIRQIFNKNKLIITSRPKFININNFGARNYDVECIEILHFDYAMRIKWIQKYESCGEVITESTKEYIENMDDKMASGVADTPLALYLLVACDMKKELQGNAWALYHEIFKNAIIDTEYNENFRTVSSHPIKRNKQLIYDIVCDIAYQMFQNSNEERYYVTGQEVSNIIAKRELDGEAREWAKLCCVLCAYWKSGTNIGALEFYHNNIRDYFFCEYIYEKLRECGQRRGVFCLDDDKFLKTMCEIMSYGSISGTTWEQTFSFLYMRLQYECNFKKNQEESSIVGLDFRESMPRVFCKMILTNKTLWEHDYETLSYQAIKNTLFNSLLLLRVWQEACRENADGGEVIKLWQDDEERRKINSAGILKEWSKIFLGEVKITDLGSVSAGKHCMLEQIDLENALLEGVDFSYSNLVWANLNGANLSNAIFRSAKLNNATFEEADLRNVDFSYADLTNVNLRNADIRGAKFVGAILKNTVFDGIVLKEADFSEATVENVDWKTQNLSELNLDGAIFRKSNLRRVKIRKAKISNVKFIECDLERILFQESNLNKIEVIRSALLKSNLTSTTIVDSAFRNLNITDANVRNAIINDTYFENVDATDAAFSQAEIKDCHFIGRCNFNRADFRKTRMQQHEVIALKNNGADVRWVILVD